MTTVPVSLQNKIRAFMKERNNQKEVDLNTL